MPSSMVYQVSTWFTGRYLWERSILPYKLKDHHIGKVCRDAGEYGLGGSIATVASQRETLGQTGECCMHYGVAGLIAFIAGAGLTGSYSAAT